MLDGLFEKMRTMCEEMVNFRIHTVTIKTKQVKMLEMRSIISEANVYFIVINMSDSAKEIINKLENSLVETL